MTRKTPLLLAFAILLSACAPQKPDYPPDGVIMPGPDAESWGILDSAIVSSGTATTGSTTTTTLQFLSAAVSDDEMADAPSLICDDAGKRVLSSTVRNPTAQEALADGTLMMIVTCGA